MLTAAERVLLHLHAHWRDPEATAAWTQKGIAAGAGLRRSHVPRTLGPLLKEGAVEVRKGRVGGRGRQVNLYRLTEAGLRRARDLLESVEARTVRYGGKDVTVRSLARTLGLTPIAVVRDLDDEGVFRPTEGGPPGGFVDREEELAHLAAWLDDACPVLVLYGPAGYGKTALAKAFLDRAGRRAAWLELGDGDFEVVVDRLLRTLRIGSDRSGEPEGIADAVARALDEGPGLLVVDGYEVPSEATVEWLRHLPEALAGRRGKLLVLARETTPSYVRFYHRDAVRLGRVTEMRLRGLPRPAARRLLDGHNLGDEAWRRIYLMTRGCPRCLELIREGDARGLQDHTRFTRAEANLLVFLRSEA